MSERHHDWPVRLRLEPTAFIAPGAVVVGEVTLGARASIWFNTVVRGDSAAIEIGDDSNVQDNSTVHVDEGMPAIVGRRVTVGHRAIVHGCVIEDDCLVGMGAVVLSGARIGAGSLIGAAALVREGQVIPPGSLAIGAPARVVGAVSDKHRDAIARGARHYAELAQTYLARGFARPHPTATSATGTTAVSRGPMSFLEWGALVATLDESPVWAAERLAGAGAEAWRRPPAPSRWSALEVSVHLRDADRDVYLPRLERMLGARMAEVADVDMRGWDAARGYAAEDPAGVLESWTAARRELVRRLAPLERADWARVGVHSVRGPFPLGEMARAWVEHDLSHRGQIDRALGISA